MTEESSPDQSQNIRIAALEVDALTSRDHRTHVKTLLSAAGAVAIMAILGAVAVRDTTLSTVGRVTALEARASASESAARSRDTDDRGTREALVRLNTTVEALRAQVEGLRGEVLSQRPTRP